MPPSLTHEAILALFRNRPTLAPEVLRDALGVDLPEYDEARIDSASLTEVTPVPYEADLVVLLVAGEPVLGIVVEVQLDARADKRWTWPYYVAALRLRLKAPALLLVVTPDEAVARSCERPIDLDGRGSILRPHVLGPASVPVVTDLEVAARAPELAVLSALSHGSEDGALEVAFAATRAVASLDDERALFYADLVLMALGSAARKALEELMSARPYEYQSEFARKYFGRGKAEGEAEGLARGEAEGLARGKAEAILSVLRHRGIAVGPDAEAAIRTCRDEAKLDAWLGLAVTATSVDVLLA